MEVIEAFADETVFRNDENGYTVLIVRTGRTRVSAVGILPPVASGEKLRITGEWVEHPVYGRQIKVHSCEIEKPTTLSGIEKYLSSGMIRGIGPATAKLLVKAFGEKTLDVLYAEPERLLEVPGIGEKRARMIQESYAEQAQQREAMLFLQSYGITPALAVKIFKQYGENVKQVVMKNPYRLVEDIEGVGFKTADRIAASLGVERDSEYRLSAGIKYALSEATGSAGHCYLPRPELCETARRLLGNDEDAIERMIDSLILDHQLTAQILPREDGEAEVAVYLPQTYRAECEVARRLREMLDAMPASMTDDLTAQLDEIERMEGITLHPQQRLAIETAVKSGMTVITGGPGTGKTTIIKCIIRLLSVGGEIALAAPTGRAAKRMSEACGMEAKTLHRLLEYGGEEGDFARTQDNPLELDTLIVDEMSMVDIFLMRSMLRALVPGTRLIMVGDADQLPSVGAGNVLRDILDSGAVPSVRLTEIFRQDEKSMIVYNAHRINHGEAPRLNAKGSDFFFERASSPADAAARIVELCAVRLPNFLGLDPVRQMQVLSPTKKGDCGVYALNQLLQSRFNPSAPGKQERTRGDTTFREGDKVMQTRNNYQLEWQKEGVFGWEKGQGVFNGDIGFVSGIDAQERTITVRFDDDREATYEGGDIDDLELAYCISVHKSQGSEFPVVVMPAVGGPPMLLTRNLLYTAVTRARRMVMLVGREAAIEQMIANANIRRRYSALRWRLEQVSSL
ncbi:MAG: ATP-dependent RecD-like DNA helicase [Clostridiales bacterium]|nr:ATP-dependent RecD-like DNA helicase [Clostridiales bacterium]MDY5514126.1 ATP-dependent RecD-like DNA helicase [Candidatus Ventricola sp.]